MVNMVNSNTKSELVKYCSIGIMFHSPLVWHCGSSTCHQAKTPLRYRGATIPRFPHDMTPVQQPQTWGFSSVAFNNASILTL